MYRSSRQNVPIIFIDITEITLYEFVNRDVNIKCWTQMKKSNRDHRSRHWAKRWNDVHLINGLFISGSSAHYIMIMSKILPLGINFELHEVKDHLRSCAASNSSMTWFKKLLLSQKTFMIKKNPFPNIICVSFDDLCISDTVFRFDFSVAL